MTEQPGFSAAFAASDQQTFLDWHASIRSAAEAELPRIESRATWDGFCVCCGKVVPFTVGTGAMFGHHPNLREGMVCPRGLNNRKRLLLRRVLRTVPRGDLAVFEARTPLTRALEETGRYALSCSEYQPADETRHEDLTDCTYPTGAFDAIVHSDVLEHIPDYRAALRESRRILRPGGVALFTIPFFVEHRENATLARFSDNGDIIHLIDPPEYHGDPLRGLVLAWHHYGWRLLDDMRSDGFTEAQVACEYETNAGIVDSNNPWQLMPPLLIVGRA